MSTRDKKKVLILGAAESSLGAARLALSHNHKVLVVDEYSVKEKFKKEFLRNNIPYKERCAFLEDLKTYDLIIKSPGVPNGSNLLQLIKTQNTQPIISEIEYAYIFNQGFIIAITGSNGKTTTSYLVYEVLKSMGFDVVLAGNVGLSYAGELATRQSEYYVLEISSFQLDDIEHFHPNISIITNITPDHLERYENSFLKYQQAKFRIIENQTGIDYLIYNYDDEIIRNYIKNNTILPVCIPFSSKSKVEQGLYYNGNEIIINILNNYKTMSIDSPFLKNKHNINNAMAAIAVAEILKIKKEVVRKCLNRFQGLEHRMEVVANKEQVTYINDSKATNINATFYALDSIQKEVIWLVGGTDKGNDYKVLLPLVREKVKGIVCLGADNSKIIKTYSKLVPYLVEAKNMEDAVNLAYRISEKNNVVLLSPACSSFDRFNDYIDRGNQFKENVGKLK